MSEVQRLQALFMVGIVAKRKGYPAAPIKPLLSIAAFFTLLFLSLSLLPSAEAATASWDTVSASQVSVKLANPVRNRRSNDATVDVSLKNTSGGEISGPLRLVITGLAPAGKVAIGNATGTTDAGEPYFDLTGYVGGNFSAGGSGLVTVIVTGGGPNTFSFSTRVEKSAAQALKVQITSPATLLTVGRTPQTVKGTVNDPKAQITLNGAPVTNNNGSFQADVALEEGHNTVSARAVNAKGEDVSDAISLSLDMTPPYLTVESPKNGDTVRTDKIAVSGLINDIVRGTVAEGQANVKVNGVAASISNRSYLAENVALNVGENTLKIDAADNVGNTSSISIKVTYQPLAPQHIELLSGQDQSAKINAALAQPLKVKLLDSANKPVANKPVIYRVTEGDGVLSVGNGDQGQGVLVQTDAQGVASTSFKLGSRAGTGNQRVRAASVGFDGEVLFYATATVGAGNKVTVNSGNNQRGAVGQPLPLPFVVAVVDDGANVVPGAPIEFKVTQGSGKFQNDKTTITSTTDSDGRATAEFTLGSEEGLDVQRVTATLVGTELYAGFTASALKTGNAGQTSISGVVLDNQEHPLPKVTVRVDGTTREAQSDANGQFKITEVPVGSVRLIADGSTTTAEGEYPTLAFNLVTIAGADNPLSAPIYLVKLDTANAQTVGDKDVTLTLPDVPGFALEVKQGSVTFPDGKKTGKLSVTPVNASKIPMAPPNGMQPQFIVTIQPVGAKFDPPARLTLPNVDGHKPGAQVEMYSYDHDLEEFVAIGLGTVASDGSVIKSNEGVGVIKAGWHCGSQPGGSGCTHNCAECQSCDASCTCYWDNSKKPTSLTDSKGDCKKPGCNNGPKQVPDTTDAPDPNAAADNACKKCDASGNIVADPAKDGNQCDSTSNVISACVSGSCKPVTLKLKEVSFLKDFDVVRDRQSKIVPVTDPVWKSTNAPADNGEVAYKRNNKLNVSAKFDITPTITKPIGGVTIQADVAGVGMIQNTGQILIGSSYDFPATDSNNNLDNATKIYEPLTLDWKFEKDGSGAFTSAGSSQNKVYLTLDTPRAYAATAGGLPVTLLKMAIQNQGATDVASALQKTWQSFSGPANITTWDNRQLYYYKAGVGFNSCALDYLALIQTNPESGQCGSFAKLLLGSLAVNGVQANWVDIAPTDGSLMIVKKWTFNGGSFPADPLYKWRLDINDGDYMVPDLPGSIYADLTNINGLPGQNSPRPSEKIFNSHFIVKALSGYYDPSYGVTYAGEQGFETSALEGYAVNFLDGSYVKGGNNYIILRARKVNSTKNITFTDGFSN
ncbi:carboxypeptidase-like regulatory domain-containing protein [Methylomonas albis]|uniref:Carboxypeptidase regulatory-like domain-containing protein n=1 Tax=Methylomonas albis TaxID=1854563 RepID=A0ABR9D6X1_9GAMM|nr:carboxypeptidase-like regulatory domain-containing protein [Methylomonas albis]MBD9358865.1 carboxypeptidase regulatory-like domain-containing protein [Methylomonas albis]